MPKRGGIRWLVDLDPADDTAYRHAVAPLVGRIERSLGPEVPWMRARRRRGGWRPAPWRPARAAWRAALVDAIAGAPRGTAFAVADVRECYASIGPETLAALLGPDAADVVAILRRLGEASVRGLPIGPEPSAVLANAALSRVDAALRASRVRHVRWVDDLVAWGPRGDVLRALEAVRRSCARLGLEVHEGKTGVLDAADDVRAVVLGRCPSTVRERRAGIIAAP